MGLREDQQEARKTVVTELTKKAVALVLFLASLLLGGLLYLFRVQIWPVLSRGHLAALLGIAVSVNLGLLLAYLFKLRPALRRLQAEAKQAQQENAKLQELIDNPPYVFEFGVYWDRQGTPHCPLDKTMPLGNFVHFPQRSMYHCAKHNHYVPLVDDDGESLTPREAKGMLEAKGPLRRNSN